MIRIIVCMLLLASCQESNQHSDTTIASPPDTITSTKNVPANDNDTNGKYSELKYKIINIRSRRYDVYVKHVSQIDEINKLLKNKYDNGDFLEINYFSDAKVAKTYFDKQFSDNVSEEEKDRLFQYYIANYKHNSNTGYDQLTFEH